MKAKFGWQSHKNKQQSCERNGENGDFKSITVAYAVQGGPTAKTLYWHADNTASYAS